MGVASALISSGQAFFGNLCSAILSACLSNVKKNQNTEYVSTKCQVQRGKWSAHNSQRSNYSEQRVASANLLSISAKDKYNVLDVPSALWRVIGDVCSSE